MANAVANSEIDRKEQAWAIEERGAATRGAGTAVKAAAGTVARAVAGTVIRAVATGTVARAVPSSATSRSARSARKSGKRSVTRNGSKSATSVKRTGSKSADKGVEMAPPETVLAKIVPVETVPGEAEPGRSTRRPAHSIRPGSFGFPARAGKCGRVLRWALGPIWTVPDGILCSPRPA